MSGRDSDKTKKQNTRVLIHVCSCIFDPRFTNVDRSFMLHTFDGIIGTFVSLSFEPDVSQKNDKQAVDALGTTEMVPGVIRSII